MREIWSSTGDPEDCAEDSYMRSVRISVTVLSSGEFRFLARDTGIETESMYRRTPDIRSGKFP